MKIPIYSIVDNVAGQAYPPFPCRNDGSAVRQYRMFIKTIPDTCDPADFILLRVGDFDDSDGSVSTVGNHEVEIVS